MTFKKKLLNKQETIVIDNNEIREIVRLEKLIQRLYQEYRDNVREIGEFRGQRYLIVNNKNIVKSLIKKLKEFGFNHLQTLTAVHYSNNEKDKNYFEVVYQLYSIEKRWQLRIRVEVTPDDLEMDSIVDLYPAANFMEREVFDLFGIKFKGHPNLKRVLLPQNWKGYPLRKDYPLEPMEKPEEFLKIKEIKELLGEYGIK